ncbi:MAG TPA: TolC family protein [Bryobacteraceae bacterium]|jgi:outer membrane protein, heavy metal efflux system|nr:TolC family protein [Bryobacteraceae bacterium]
MAIWARISGLILLCAGCGFGQLALTLQDALDRALSTHGLLAAGQNRVGAAEGLQRQAGLMPNPRLVLQLENVRPYGNPAFQFNRDTDQFAYLQYMFETAGKRGLRGEVAAAVVGRAEMEREMLAAQIRARVKLAYWQAAGAAQIQRWLDEDFNRFGEVVRYHEVRVKEGATAESDLLRVQLEASRLRLSASNARLAAERARIDLLREMGQREFPELIFSDSIETIRPEITEVAESALERRSEVKLARQIQLAAQRQARLQEALSKPNVDVLLGYKRTAGLDTMLAGVQMELPMANRNQGNLSAALSEVKVAESNLAAVEAVVRAEVESARRSVAIRKTQVDSILSAMRAQSSESQRIADAAYRVGGVELLRLLDAERARIETQILYYQTLSEYQQAVSSLETALGIL